MFSSTVKYNLGVLYSWGRITSIGHNIRLILFPNTLYSPFPPKFQCGLQKEFFKTRAGVYEGTCIHRILQPLTVVFALLYFVTFCTKIIQKEAEGGEECWSSLRNCAYKSPDFIQLCATTLPALCTHQQDLCSLSWQILTSKSIVTRPCLVPKCAYAQL